MSNSFTSLSLAGGVIVKEGAMYILYKEFYPTGTATNYDQTAYLYDEYKIVVTYKE